MPINMSNPICKPRIEARLDRMDVDAERRANSSRWLTKGGRSASVPQSFLHPRINVNIKSRGKNAGARRVGDTNLLHLAYDW
jgi:hypothetical protein